MIQQINQVQPFLTRLAYSYTKNESDAKDLVQETLLKVITKYDQFKTGTNFKGWVAMIMRNTFINQYRKSKRFSLVDIDHISPKKFHIENEVEYDLFSNEVDKIMSELEPSQQEVLDFVRQGYSYVEIAEKLNIPIGTIKSKIHFARKNVKFRYNQLMKIANYGRA